MEVHVNRRKLGWDVRTNLVSEKRGSLGVLELGLIITTSNFSKGALKEAARADAASIEFMNGDQLFLLLSEHRVGVSSKSSDLLKINEDDDK